MIWSGHNFTHVMTAELIQSHQNSALMFSTIQQLQCALLENTKTYNRERKMSMELQQHWFFSNDAEIFSAMDPGWHTWEGCMDDSHLGWPQYTNVLNVLLNGEMECLWCICCFVALCIDDIHCMGIVHLCRSVAEHKTVVTPVLKQQSYFILC